MLHDPIHISPDLHHWLDTSSPLIYNRIHDWSVSQLDSDGTSYEDNLYDLSVEAVREGMIRCPEGVDVWCEYVNPISVQVYVSISDPSHYNAAVTVVSPITPLVRLDNNERGSQAAVFALQVVCEIASVVFREVQLMSEVMVAQSASNSAVLDVLAAEGNAAVCAAIMTNPHASDETKTLCYLRTQQF